MQFRTLFSAAVLAGGLTGSAVAQPPLPPQLTYVQPLSRGGVQAVQQQLARAGEYHGQVDGVWGPDSVVALQQFQQTHGLQVTGQLNQATVATLGLDPDMLLGAPRPGVAASVPEPGALRPQAIRAVQQRLGQLGFYRGPADGVWGPETQTAIAQFQQSRGLQANSQLNPATISALGLSAQALVSQ